MTRAQPDDQENDPVTVRRTLARLAHHARVAWRALLQGGNTKWN